MKVILTGATGIVGEGVLLECLESPLVQRVLSVSRRSCGRTHEKLTELLVADFRELGSVEAELTGGYFLVRALYPVLNLFFPGMALRDVARAMINAARLGAPKPVLEVADLRELAAR